jgi:hypothetical protein
MSILTIEDRKVGLPDEEQEAGLLDEDQQAGLPDEDQAVGLPEEDREDRRPPLTSKRKRISARARQAQRARPPPERSAQELNHSRSHAPKTGTDFEGVLTPKDAARFLRLSTSWLAKARMRGDGPPFVKLGRSVRYGEGALAQWMKSRMRLSTSER